MTAATETVAPASAQPSPAQPVWKTAVLETGFVRGDETITKVRLRKPRAGELRGLNIQDLLRADVAAVIGILPRISDPIMTREDADNLAAEDLAECAGIVAGFFMNSEQREMIARMTSTS